MVTIDVKCIFYNQTDDIKKHGTGCGHNQRYRCQSCRKTFQIDYTYCACKPRIKEQIIYLTMNNAGIRDTARALHISINAVVRALKKLLPRCVTIFPLDKLKIDFYAKLMKCGHSSLARSYNVGCGMHGNHGHVFNMLISV